MKHTPSTRSASCVIGRWARLLSVGCALSLAGCADVTPAPLHGGSYPLAEHQQAALGGGVSVLYDRFEDSRCPKDVYCIQAGKVRYHFILSGPAGNENISLEPEGDAKASASVPGLGFGISFKGVAGMSPAQHPVVLEVRVGQPAAVP